MKLNKEPLEPTGVRVGEMIQQDGRIVGVLAFYTDEDEFNFYVSRQSVDLIEDAVRQLRQRLEELEQFK